MATVPDQCNGLIVPCLQDLTDLKRLCEDQGIKCNDEIEDSSEEVFEVDAILEDSVEKGVHWYLVKWKNYPMSEATWEPVEHLGGCDQLLLNYHTTKDSILGKPFVGKMNLRLFENFIRTVTKKDFEDAGTLIKLGSVVGINGISPNHPISTTALLDMKKRLFALTKYGKKRLAKIEADIINVIDFHRKRISSLRKLKVWEQEINEHTFPPLRVVNDVDCEEPPDFQFIQDYIFIGMTVQNQPLIGCECSECNSQEKNCCPHMAKEKYAYDKFGKLKLLPGYPIYECNSLCKCPPTCSNRVVQKGQQVKLEIFKTSNSRGWGLRTLQRLKRGQFILEYIGEVITSEEAERRRYDDGESYLFDLDFDHKDCSYTVDARHFGNAAHFINHSCDPNLHVFAVWINHLDPRLPRLAFFARRNIKCGEELTFDYRMNKETGILQHSSPPSSPKSNLKFSTNENNNKKKSGAEKSILSRIPCHCEADNCRGFLF